MTPSFVVGAQVSSGPLGGDQEIGGRISNGEVGVVFFFRDPLSAHPHEADIHALCRLCDVHDCTIGACRPLATKYCGASSSSVAHDVCLVV
jgi:methylglyoxal synthase